MQYSSLEHKAEKPKKKKIKLSLISALALFICATYTLAMLFWPLQEIEPQIVQVPLRSASPLNLDWPAFGQSAVGTIDRGVLASSSQEQIPVPTASIAKVLTSLIVLENKPIKNSLDQGPEITFTAQDQELYSYYLSLHGSVVRATAGMKLSEYQILQGMLISSANNYADSLSIWAFGSKENYLQAAQKYLEKHNISHTTLADASGFSPQTQSTAQDLVQIGILAMQNPVIKNIVNQSTATLPGVGILHNTNRLLGDRGVIGLKTGTTDQAGSCLLFSVDYSIGIQKTEIVGVVLGATDHTSLFNSVSSLIASTKANFYLATAVQKEKIYATYTTPWGSTSHAAPITSKTVVLWKSDPVSTYVKAKNISLDEFSVGDVQINNGPFAMKVPLALDTKLHAPNWKWRLTHPLQVVK